MNQENMTGSTKAFEKPRFFSQEMNICCYGDHFALANLKKYIKKNKSKNITNVPYFCRFSQNDTLSKKWHFSQEVHGPC